MYINHIYQLAASARSVIEENHQLRTYVEAMGGGPKLSPPTLVCFSRKAPCIAASDLTCGQVTVIC